MVPSGCWLTGLPATPCCASSSSISQPSLCQHVAAPRIKKKRSFKVSGGVYRRFLGSNSHASDPKIKRKRCNTPKKPNQSHPNVSKEQNPLQTEKTLTPSTHPGGKHIKNEPHVDPLNYTHPKPPVPAPKRDRKPRPWSWVLDAVGFLAFYVP